MNIYISFLFFSVICFVGVFVFAGIHKEKLKQILEYTNENLKEAKYIQQSYLVVANILLALATMFITMTFSGIDIFIVIDMSLSIFTILFVSCIYFLIKKQNTSSNWLEFWIGFIVGCVLSTILLPSEYAYDLFLTIINLNELHNYLATISVVDKNILILSLLIIMDLLFIGIGCLFLVLGLIFLIIIIGYYKRQHIFVPGAILGYLIFPTLEFTLYEHNFIFTWLFFAFSVGVLFGVFYISRQNLTIWMLILIPIILRLFYPSIILFFALMLGAFLFLIYTFEPRIEIKLIGMTIFAVATLVIAVTNHELGYTMLIVAALGTGEFFIAWLYRDAVRSIFKRWISLSLQSNASDKVNLSEHESIPDFKKTRVTKNSFFFAYLNHLLLKYLEREGFYVEITEEEHEQTVYVKGIYVSLQKSAP